MHLKNLLPLLMSLFLIIASADVMAQKSGKKDKGKGGAPAATNNGGGADKNGIKPYSKVITKKAETDSGLFQVHKIDDKYYYEIPDTLFGREMLMVTRMAKSAAGLGYGGNKFDEQMLRWQKKGNDVLLRVVSHEIYADDSLPVHQAVSNSNFEPILRIFPIEAYNKDTTATVIDVTELFATDVKSLSLPMGWRQQYKVTSMDSKRSYIESIKSYPNNIESRHVKTYNSSAPPSNYSTGSISLEINNSMILLPKVPMKRRYFDQRVGWFTSAQTDYGDESQRSKTVRYLDRWRLEVAPEDMDKFLAGELVEPVKQIVYYIDPATPHKWRKYLKQGVEDWQAAFEAAGFKNAIIAKDPPTPEEDPDWSPEDARYSVIRYLASPIPNAMGPHVSDPRSGEILESDIHWYHNVMSLLRGWFFVQTAAINPDAQGPEFDDEVMGQLIRFVSAHEVGHTLGLPHNMGSSVAYPVDSLRSPSFTKRMGTAPSIMDYARFNYVAQPGDGDVALMPNIGVYDKHAIRWGYRPIPDAETAEDEKKTLDGWILEHKGDPLYRFGRQQFGVVDPSSQTEDLGDDAVKASKYGIENMKRIVPNLIEWTKEPGEDFDDLNEMFGHVYSQYGRYMGHVVSNIGGIYEHFKSYDENEPVYTHVSKEHQQKCMKFLHEELFETPTWMIDQAIYDRIGYTGQVEKIRSMQVRTLNDLLDFNRLGRIIENEVINGDKAYSMIEMMTDLREGIWKETKTGAKIDTYRRNLQRAYIERMKYLMESDGTININMGGFQFRSRPSLDVVQSDIRAVVKSELKTLQAQLKAAVGKTSDKMSKLHLQDAVDRIDEILNPK